MTSGNESFRTPEAHDQELANAHLVMNQAVDMDDERTAIAAQARINELTGEIPVVAEPLRVDDHAAIVAAAAEAGIPVPKDPEQLARFMTRTYMDSQD